jgi:hypothetical protein
MNNHKFLSLASKGKNYFSIHDSAQVEFANDSLYAKSKIVWSDCHNYFLIVDETHYQYGLKTGDTLNVKLLSIDRDTISYEATAYGQVYRGRVVRFE